MQPTGWASQHCIGLKSKDEPADLLPSCNGCAKGGLLAFLLPWPHFGFLPHDQMLTIKSCSLLPTSIYLPAILSATKQVASFISISCDQEGDSTLTTRFRQIITPRGTKPSAIRRKWRREANAAQHTFLDPRRGFYPVGCDCLGGRHLFRACNHIHILAITVETALSKNNIEEDLGHSEERSNFPHNRPPSI